MLHTIQEMMDKVSAMHGLAVQAHRIKYGKAPGEPYDSDTVTHLVLVCNQEGHYPELLKQLEHCAHPDATRRLKRIQMWTESVSNKHLE